MVVQGINMKVIKLKSNINWCTHELHSLTPLCPKENELVFKIVKKHSFEILRNEMTRLPSGIAFQCGPNILIGEINSQIGMPLKEICSAFDSEGNYLYTVLIFDYDISSNEETGII